MIGIVLTLINTAFFAGTWYFRGRASIYKMIMDDYKEVLDIASRMKITIDAYKAKYNTKETEEENEEQD